MKDKITRTTLATRGKGQTDFERLRKMRDEDIDYSNISQLDAAFWKSANLTLPYRMIRQSQSPKNRDYHH
jgi:hypothetical protein